MKWSMKDETTFRNMKLPVCEVLLTEEGREYLLSLHNSDDYNITLSDDVMSMINCLEKERIGMYGENPEIKIGKYTISRFSNKREGSIWIEHEDGEGCQLNTNIVEPYIDECYIKYF